MPWAFLIREFTRGAGNTKMHHLEEAVAALEVQLSAAEMTALEELYQPRAVAGHR